MTAELATHGGGERPRFPLTQSELAEMVGGSRQSVNQRSSRRRIARIPGLRGREFAILDLEGLGRRAEAEAGAHR